jgi:hypothetical protein
VAVSLEVANARNDGIADSYVLPNGIGFRTSDALDFLNAQSNAFPWFPPIRSSLHIVSSTLFLERHAVKTVGVC